MIKKVLVADEDLDAHEILQDMLHISLEGVTIDRVMTGENFLKKIGEVPVPYDLILLNIRMKHENGTDILASVKKLDPGLMDRIVLLADAPGCGESATLENQPCIPKPFSLDYFGEVVKKVCRA